jgi:hypothetical protein
MAKSQLSEKIILGIFAIILLIFAIEFVRSTIAGSGHGRENIVVPVGMIAVFISLYLFKEYNRVRKAKREHRREYMSQRRQELLDAITKKNNKSTPYDPE